jgi:thermitase
MIAHHSIGEDRSRLIGRRGLCVIMMLGLTALAAAPPDPPRQPIANSGRAGPIAGAAAVDRPDVSGGYESSYIIVKVKPGVQSNRLNDGRWTFRHSDHAGPAPEAASAGLATTLQRHGAHNIKRMFAQAHINPQNAASTGLDRYYRIAIPRGSNAPAVAREIRGHAALIEIAQADNIGTLAVVPNDSFFNQQWDMLNTGQSGGTPGADCNATAAWDLHQGSSSVTIAIIDSGVQHFDSNIAGSVDHPDLVGRVITGWNTRDDNNNTLDENGHGTHVSGIAAANSNNNMGVAGMNWNAMVLAMRVTDAIGNANQTDVAEAVTYAVNHGANIVSMSLQFYGGPVQALQDAVAYAYDSGVLPIAATGNNQSPGTIAYPAKYPKCMAVGATDRLDHHAGFSNNGAEIDLSAPGAEIFGLWNNSQYTNGMPITTQSGTSMATPHVSGLAGLMLSYNHALTPAQIEHLLKVTCRDLGTPGWDSLFGWGRIDARAALQAAARPADVTRNGIVNIDDLLLVVTTWGACAPNSLCPADIDANGVVNIDDLLAVINNWG